MAGRKEQPTKNTAKEKHFKVITVSRAQLDLGRRIKQADLVLSVRKYFLDAALVNLEALSGSKLLRQLQRRGNGAE